MAKMPVVLNFNGRISCGKQLQAKKNQIRVLHFRQRLLSFQIFRIHSFTWSYKKLPVVLNSQTWPSWNGFDYRVWLSNWLESMIRYSRQSIKTTFSPVYHHRRTNTNNLFHRF